MMRPLHPAPLVKSGIFIGGKEVCYTLLMDHGLHHLHSRKRIYKNLEPYPHPSAWARFVDRTMYVIGIGAPLVLIPQIAEVWVDRNVGGISIFTWSAFAVINVFWLVYGSLHKEKPLIISSGLLIVLNFAVAFGVVLFR